MPAKRKPNTGDKRKKFIIGTTSADARSSTIVSVSDAETWCKASVTVPQNPIGTEGGAAPAARAPFEAAITDKAGMT
eukprot:CAMPEP_0169417622 /NCGR_PEP_ID=MMETSP1017-20121227/63823_1 /TAXON_ID=342587 /ORGANISM="Karlodinium micrum, Strain CCMP2283" /LENGTH=76 /DNA_ID=CAMNT_0009525787 /DNA_START=143 /DNA_END=373 /DNA_ORIENTATION=+